MGWGWGVWGGVVFETYVDLCSTGKNKIDERATDFFLYPPFSGIAPCVGIAGTVHDAYT